MNDNETKINELKQMVQKFCEDRDWDQFHNPKDLSIMISTEAAELLEIFRYKNEEQLKEIMQGAKREDVEDEVADVLFGVLRFAQMNSIDLTSALKNKIEKSAKKYPADLVRGKKKKYNEY